MESFHLLWIGNPSSNYSSFPAVLKDKPYKVKLVPTGGAAEKRIQSGKRPDAVVVDAASLRTTGTRICSSLKKLDGALPTILITSCDFPPANGVAADVHLTQPFTFRKLKNRLKLYKPGEGENVIQSGSIELDPDRQILRCENGEDRITPRMIALMKLLIQNRGEIMEREELFRQAWDTSYTGDTRSLDVHISWLRKILEKDPQNPDLLITVHGVGYLLTPIPDDQ